MIVRDILFKAKEIKSGKWVYGYYKKVYDMHFIDNPGSEGDFYQHIVDKNTICQYTGLTDKNGNKIWENDVVEVTYRDSRFAENYTEIGFIKYFSCSARYRYVFKEETWNFDCSNEIEVIGNIFDNPELMKGE